MLSGRCLPRLGQACALLICLAGGSWYVGCLSTNGGAVVMGLGADAQLAMTACCPNRQHAHRCSTGRVAAGPAASDAGTALLRMDSSAVVKLHNTYRSMHRAAPLKWSGDLQKSAARYARKVRRRRLTV